MTASDSTSLTERAHAALRRRITRLELAPGELVRLDELSDELGIGRTPVREAVQRLEREQLVRVVPRRGVFVTSVEVADLPLLYETRALLEPYAARLAAARGTPAHWRAMSEALADADSDPSGPHRGDADTPAPRPRRGRGDDAVRRAGELLDIDRRCHEIMWDAAANRFLVDTLDTLYAQSERVWHLYLADVTDMHDAIAEHALICEALRAGDGDTAARLAEAHVRSFDAQVRRA
ncbi:MAG: GntR family transcriptional regulator, partial [Actinomyces sp.]